MIPLCLYVARYNLSTNKYFQYLCTPPVPVMVLLVVHLFGLSNQINQFKQQFAWSTLGIVVQLKALSSFSGIYILSTPAFLNVFTQLNLSFVSFLHKFNLKNCLDFLISFLVRTRVAVLRVLFVLLDMIGIF
jgi:hypothetical protein